MAPNAFERQIKILKQHFELVTVGQLLDPKANLPEVVAAVTFDDGPKDFLEHALPVLKAWNVPATVFVTSDAVAGNRVLDVHKLQLLQGMIGLEELQRRWSDAETALGAPENLYDPRSYGVDPAELYIYDDEQTRRFKLRLNYELPHNYRTRVLTDLFVEEMGLEADVAAGLYLSLQDLRGCGGVGIEIAAHTASHVILSRLGECDQRTEIKQSIDFVHENFGIDSPSLAYPFGGRGTWNSTTKKILRNLEVAGTVTMTREIVKPADLEARWEIPRYSVSDVFVESGDLNYEVVSLLPNL